MAVELQPADDNDEPTPTPPGGAAANTDAEPEEWQPPTKAEFEKMQRDLARANRESKERREKLAELAKATEDADGKRSREQAEAAEARYKPIAVRAAARAAFLEAGLPAGTDGMAKLVRLLDLDAIDVTDDGEVSGLQEQVNQLKADFPALFATPRQRAPRLDTGSRAPAPAGPKTSAQRIAAQVLGTVA